MLDELLPREKCSDPALLPSATELLALFTYRARREKMLRRWQRDIAALWVAVWPAVGGLAQFRGVNGIGSGEIQAVERYAESARRYYSVRA